MRGSHRDASVPRLAGYQASVIIRFWNRHEPCPERAANAFNIDSKLNGAYIALGMLYGERDFGKTMTISTRCGQDSDCNPASAVGILGVVLGLEGIPDRYKSGIEEIADEEFSYTDHSFRTIVDSTAERAVAMAERHGGRVDGDALLVKTQDPVPATLEIWDDYGSPVEHIPVTDDRWSWKGEWQGKTSNWGPGRPSGPAAGGGAQATIEFDRKGAIISGFYLPSGGKADIYLDGALDRTVDVDPDEDRPKGWESVWHDYRLEDGRHELRIVVRGEPYPGSAGTDTALTHLVVFR